MFRKVLMCKPTFYDVIHHDLNKYMSMKQKVNKTLAMNQWNNLVTHLQNSHVNIDFIKPQKNLVDMVFSANPSIVYKQKVIISNFQAKPRIPESTHYKNYYSDNNYQVYDVPTDIFLEGGGDILFSHNKTILWCGYGFRSSEKSLNFLNYVFDNDEIEIIQLKLTNPLYYHLDTCFCPIGNGKVMIYKGAFNYDSLHTIYSYFGKDNVIEITSTDAENFVCNSIYTDANNEHTIIGHKFSKELRFFLENKNYKVIETPMDQFLLSGGSCKCMVIDLL